MAILAAAQGDRTEPPRFPPTFIHEKISKRSVCPQVFPSPGFPHPHSSCPGCQRHSPAGSPLLRRVSISAGVRDQGSEIREQKSRIAKFTLDIDQIIHNYRVVDNLDTTFAALSDPTRRAMIERLSHGPASVHGLTEPFALSQQMISKHIAYLVRARMVIKTKRGRESVCTLRPEAIKTVSDWAISYRRFWEESFDKLDVVVRQMKKEGVRDDRKHG